MNDSYNKGFRGDMLGGNNHDWHQGKRDREALESGNTTGPGVLLFIICALTFLLPYSVLALTVSLIIYAFRLLRISFKGLFICVLLALLMTALSFVILCMLLIVAPEKLLLQQSEFIIFPLLFLAIISSLLIGSYAFYKKVNNYAYMNYGKSFLITCFVIIPLSLTVLGCAFFLANEFYFKPTGVDLLNLA